MFVNGLAERLQRYSQEQQLRTVNHGAGKRDSAFLSFAQIVNSNLDLFPDSKRRQEIFDAFISVDPAGVNVIELFLLRQ
jgi:hypothetical protein